MNITATAIRILEQVKESTILKGAVSTVAFLLILLSLLLILLLITALLKFFFDQHALITRAQKILIYLLTMVGVLALGIGGLLGFVLPLIPGLVLIFFALLLLRRYHRNEWMESRFKQLARTLRIKIKTAKKYKKKENKNIIRGEKNARAKQSKL